MIVTDILDKEGKVTNGAFSFYHCPGGLVLFSEEGVEEVNDCYVFDLNRTALIIPATGPHGEVGMLSVKAAGRPELMLGVEYMIPKGCVGRIRSSSPELYANCRKNCSLIATTMSGPHR